MELFLIKFLTDNELLDIAKQKAKEISVSDDLIAKIDLETVKLARYMLADAMEHGYLKNSIFVKKYHDLSQDYRSFRSQQGSEFITTLLAFGCVVENKDRTKPPTKEEMNAYRESIKPGRDHNNLTNKTYRQIFLFDFEL